MTGKPLSATVMHDPQGIECYSWSMSYSISITKTTMTKKETQQSAVALGLPVLNEGLSIYTGEDTRIPRLEVPIIRVAYKSEDDETKVAPKGEFIEYNPSTKVSKGLGKSVVIQILHHRQSLSSYTENESFYTPEVSMRTKTVPLFSRTKGVDGSSKTMFVMNGEMKAIRERFSQLRYQRVMYVLHEGALKQLVVYGASFSKFIDLQKALKGASTTSALIELTTTKEKKGTVIYYPISFTVKQPVDLAASEPVLKELSDWFSKYDELIAKQQFDRAEEAAIKRGDGPTPLTHRTPGGQTGEVGSVGTMGRSSAVVAPTPSDIADELGLDTPVEEKKRPTDAEVDAVFGAQE